MDYHVHGFGKGQAAINDGIRTSTEDTFSIPDKSQTRSGTENSTHIWQPDDDSLHTNLQLETSSENATGGAEVEANISKDKDLSGDMISATSDFLDSPSSANTVREIIERDGAVQDVPPRPEVGQNSLDNEVKAHVMKDQEIQDDIPDSLPWFKAVDEMRENMEWDIMPRETPAIELAQKRVHVMGLNIYGNFIAQSLANSGTPVTLLMHRPLLMQDWHDEGGSIRLLKDGEVHTTSGFHVESTAVELGQDDPEKPVYKRFGSKLEHSTEPPDTIIETLFIASNPGIILTSLNRVAHRLRPHSTICFCQDGLGIIDKVNKTIFPDPDDRPNYMLANFTHKLEAGRGMFDVAEISGGTLSCTKLPRVHQSTDKETALTITRKDFSWPLTSKYLVGVLLQAPGLNTKSLGHKSFHRQQLMKVAMHAVIDPISVAFEVKSEELLYNYKISQYMKMVLGEISLVIRSLPELDSIPQVKKDFSVERLQARANNILNGLGDTYTEFLLDTRRGRVRAGMDFYSGYILERARQLRIQCPVLDALTLQVEGKQQFYSRAARNFIPFERTSRRAIEDDDDGKV